MSKTKIINIIARTSQNFEVNDYSMLALIVKPQKNKGLQKEELQDSIPTELLFHRYLMHPIRITIMKLLDSNDYLPSFEVRQILGVSWGEYNSHLKSLEERGYIEIRNSFNEQAQLVLTLYPTQSGKARYQELLTLLKKFTIKDAPVRRIIGNNTHPIYDSELYPSDDE